MVGRRKLSDPSLNRILMLYWLVYNIRSHFNELILAWSAYNYPKISEITNLWGESVRYNLYTYTT